MRIVVLSASLLDLKCINFMIWWLGLQNCLFVMTVLGKTELSHLIIHPVFKSPSFYWPKEFMFLTFLLSLILIMFTLLSLDTGISIYSWIVTWCYFDRLPLYFTGNARLILTTTTITFILLWSVLRSILHLHFPWNRN